mgnify:CR=1 FL=1
MDDYVDVEILEHQIEFIESRSTHTGLVAGFGAGKSKAATYKCIEKLKEYPSINVAYYLPTYGLIKDIAYDNFNTVFDMMGISYSLNKTDHVYETSIGKVILRSLMDPELIVGYEVGYSVIDEADLVPIKKMRTALIKIIGRNRMPLPDFSVNSIDLVSTPEGFRFMWEFFVKKKSPKKVLIQAKSRDNPFLPLTYFETLEETYSPEQLAAYMDGEFVNLTSGNVYRNFDRELNHTDRTLQKGERLHIGMDFNITNMSAVIHVIESDGSPTAVDEITRAFDTREMIRIIQERFPDHKVIVYPDASGKAKKTSAAQSDIDLLKGAKFVVRTGKGNPFVRDRVNAMNNAFKNNKTGKRTYKVNTDNCPEYTEALEQQTYKNGEPDKTSGFDHITEAGGYFIFGNKKKRTSISAT